MTHTQGPWNAEPGGGRGAWIKGSTGEWTALACGDTDESANANARLIAAAPEMLEALALILPLAKGYAAANRVGSNAAYIAAAEAALAKARP